MNTPLTRSALIVCFTTLQAGLQSTVHAWQPVAGQLMTRWAQEVSPENAWPEYPRPQMVRKDWHNLNGLWDYAIRDGEEKERPAAYDGKILVPYPVESALSGVKKPVGPRQRLWYHREFTLPQDFQSKRVLLHFEAVDFHAKVWVNNMYVGEHRGGYDPFTFDITDQLVGKPRGGRTQKIEVAVTDPTDKGTQPRGKQILDPHGIWYTAVTGIWQTVWLEAVPATYIQSLRITPDLDNHTIGVIAEVSGADGTTVHVTAEKDSSTARGTSGKTIQLKLSSEVYNKPWSPDQPQLYDLTVQVKRGGQTVDHVSSYFALRKVEVAKAKDGFNRLFLNGKPLFHYGPLDQGWWPDGLHTPPSDEAMRYDLDMLKEMGFNMIRKHVKVEPRRYYYHCDKMGFLVWQDMPSGDKYIGGQDPDIKRSEESGRQFEYELRELIETLYNHPSIVMWVIYNEGWGQWDTPRITRWTRQLDPTRIINSVSGWADRGVGDVIDKHSYPGPAMFPPEPRRATVLGEFGGLGWPVKGHLWQDRSNWGYRTYHSQEVLQSHYASRVQALLPLISQGLAAAVYTQTSDVEGEVNGLVTYDRVRVKFDVQQLRTLHEKLYGPPMKIIDLVPTSSKQPQSWRYTFDEPAENWIQPGYDDSSWRNGTGMFGTSKTTKAKIGTQWNTEHIWLRRTITLDRVPENPQLSVFHDDDAAVYLNGVLAAKLGGATGDYAPTPISEQAHRSLKPGHNTIAVHCRNTGGVQAIDVGFFDMQ